MKTNSSTFRQSAFTLIELLVVMAIIGLLSGLFLPAVSGAMRSAKETTKRNNLRSMWQANELYMANNKGRICLASDKRQGSNANWRDLLSPYLGKASENRGDANDEHIFIDPFYDEYDEDNPTRTGYAMNAKPALPYSNKANAFWNETFQGQQVLIEQVELPSNRVFIGDATDGWFFTDDNIDEVLSTDRHKLKGQKAGMFLMFDGSVRLLHAAQARKAILDPASF